MGSPGWWGEAVTSRWLCQTLVRRGGEKTQTRGAKMPPALSAWDSAPSPASAFQNWPGKQQFLSKVMSVSLCTSQADMPRAVAVRGGRSSRGPAASLPLQADAGCSDLMRHMGSTFCILCPPADSHGRQVHTAVPSPFQLLFDFLAFKNDISFWKKKKSMIGMSTKAGRCPWDF